VAERAFLRDALLLVEPDDAVGARGDAVAAAVAYVVLDVDGVVLGPHERVRRAHFHAARVLTVLTDVAHHQPRLPSRDGRRAEDNAIVVRHLLDELDVAPVLRVELAGVVERVRCELWWIALELIPLFARDLARLAADADRRVGEESHRAFLECSHYL